ncbi:MAG: UDP-N-acetylmuramate:L-alanyl-gamma-D-glutamyl-meso-diaminopimelate ligase [Bdellovibrionaceae bacterium]|nr:UDP-N-acetylmuramate:L-alanyl-gamma-D-glutamyl-meso-diaminopimelate ligase [Pseudobdellovibrionaceae bacterium]|tara:strand:- start:102 stop:1541 length:1440 start_codon:yes stop_codon:yes gene_type:complete
MSEFKISDLKHVHVVGACGTLMGAFCSYLKSQGIRVTGSDQNIYPPMSEVLASAGVELFSGYSEENIKNIEKTVDLVVIGNVIRRENPEAQYVMKEMIPYTSLPEFMKNGLLQETRNLICAGTHGKTTTSSMLAHVLKQLNADPSYFIGGVSLDLPQSFYVSDNETRYFVLEGDEYDTAFWDKVPKFTHYRPTDVILTSVEFDHADIYDSFEQVIVQFEKLIENIDSKGRVIACIDYPVMSRVLEKAKVPVLTYGSHAVSFARFVPAKIETTPEGTRFDIMDSGKKVGSLKIHSYGNHNILNAMSVWIECRELGYSAEEIAVAFESFHGVKRRQEVRGVIQGRTVIDDFAHHPTAVKETVEAFRQKYPNQRLVVVFEPRSATSRRRVFQKDFIRALKGADAVFISEPYDQSHIEVHDRFSSQIVVDDLKRKHVDAFLMKSIEEGVSQIADYSQSGDVIAVLSNGGFGGLIPKLLSRLEQ